MKQILSILAVALSLSSGAICAQEDLAAKRVAADRYIRATPTTLVMDEMIAEIAKSLPAKDAEVFLGTVKESVDERRMDAISRDALVKIFSLEELNALADFYSSKHGASSMKKMGSYMAELFPLVTAEIQRSLKSKDQRK